VAVLSLLDKDDVQVFHKAIPNVDYRCQVLHESVTCNTELALYAVATTAVEFVLIVIVPSVVRQAYIQFTNLVRKDYLYWLFKPGSDDFDKKLERMPRYKQGDIKWGYAKDDETIRCRLLVMMGLFDLRKESGRPLPPSDGLKPLMVSMWNVGKGPIDDMSQVSSTCLPSFGPINGISWIWIRTWILLTFNAWRLTAMHASSDFVLSDQCDSRKKFLAARGYHGKTYAEFLQSLYDNLQMPLLLRGGEEGGIDDSMSPQRPTTKKSRISYHSWATEDDWINFRTTPHSGHVPSHIPTLVRGDFLQSSGEKRKRGETAEDDNVGSQEGIDCNPDGITAVTTPVKSGRAPDRRKWCFRCSYWTRDATRVKTISRVVGSKPKKTNQFCMRCQVALCQDCFRPWHDVAQLLSTPTDEEESQPTFEEV
jgi:hypothetical protein